MSKTTKGDYGIIYSKNGAGTGAYVDILGSTQNSGTITTSYTAAGDALVGSRYPSIMDIGSYTALSLFVTVNLSVATDMLLKVQVQYADGEPWCDIQSVREDTGTVAAEHTFVAGSYCVQTASITATGQCRVVAKATAGGAMNANDWILIKARALG